MNVVKKFIQVFFVAFTLFFSQQSFAQPPEQIENKRPTYVRICEIRKIFCGGVSIAAAMAGILLLGFLILSGQWTGKPIAWTTIVVVGTGLIIFLSAEQFFTMIGTHPSGVKSKVLQACSCS